MDNSRPVKGYDCPIEGCKESFSDRQGAARHLKTGKAGHLNIGVLCVACKQVRARLDGLKRHIDGQRLHAEPTMLRPDGQRVNCWKIYNSDTTTKRSMEEYATRSKELDKDWINEPNVDHLLISIQD